MSHTSDLEVILNSYSSVLHYNHIDYQALLEEEKKKNKKPHDPTLIRQLIYFLIFCFLFLGLVIQSWSGLVNSVFIYL